MTAQDEKELRRLTDMLREIDGMLQSNSPLKEGVAKAALALSTAFIHDLRPEIERFYNSLGTPLSELERSRLNNLGINPDV